MSLLTVSDLTIRFGGHVAVDAVDLSVEPAQLVGLIGPNGAGKTTIFNAICGMQKATSGQVRFDGADITNLPTHKRAQAGIARTFQRLEIFGSLTVRENVLVAAELRRSREHDRSDPSHEVMTLLDRVGVGALADERCDSLPTGQARLVELARALACHPKLLLLDEPASGLTEDETAIFGGLLGELVADGLAVLLVEHDVELVMSVCERIAVLDFGHIIARGVPAEIRNNIDVLAAYLGEPA